MIDGPPPTPRRWTYRQRSCIHRMSTGGCCDLASCPAPAASTADTTSARARPSPQRRIVPSAGISVHPRIRRHPTADVRQFEAFSRHRINFVARDSGPSPSKQTGFANLRVSFGTAPATSKRRDARVKFCDTLALGARRPRCCSAGRTRRSWPCAMRMRRSGRPGSFRFTSRFTLMERASPRPIGAPRTARLAAEPNLCRGGRMSDQAGTARPDSTTPARTPCTRSHPRPAARTTPRPPQRRMTPVTGASISPSNVPKRPRRALTTDH